MPLCDLGLKELREYRSETICPGDFDSFWETTSFRNASVFVERQLHACGDRSSDCRGFRRYVFRIWRTSYQGMAHSTVSTGVKAVLHCQVHRLRGRKRFCPSASPLASSGLCDHAGLRLRHRPHPGPRSGSERRIDAVPTMTPVSKARKRQSSRARRQTGGDKIC